MAKKKAPPSIRLKELRVRRKLSMAEFGKLLGVGSSRVFDWESGRHKPSRDHGIAIAALTQAFGSEIRVEDW